MKIFIVFAAILAVSFATTHLGLGENIECIQKAEKNTRIFESEIRAKIEELRKRLKEEGIPELGIDSLDPLVLDTQRIQLETPVELDLNISQKTDGLLGFNITKLSVQLIGLKFDFTINWPLINTHNDYGLLLNVMGKDIFGNGQIDSTTKNFAISGHGSVTNKLVGGKVHIQIQNLSISLSLGSFNFKITGFMNDPELSDIISKTITDMGPIAIKEAEKELNDRMSELIQIINDWIINHTMYQATPLAIC